MPRLKAPRGGAVGGDKQYVRGGQYLTGPLKRIRAVVRALRRTRLSLLRAVEGVTTTPTPETGTFTLPQLQAIEHHFDIPHSARLSPHVTVHPETGHLSAPSTQHVHTFVEHLQSAVQHRGGAVGDLRHLPPDHAGAVAVAMASELDHAALMPHGADASQWYGDHVRALVEAARDVHGIVPGSARDTLHRTLVAINSTGQNPKLNTAIAYKQLAQAGGDFARIPERNERALAQWRAAYAAAHKGAAPDTHARFVDEEYSQRSLNAAAQWYRARVASVPGLRDVGYTGIPAWWSPTAKGVVAYERSGTRHSTPAARRASPGERLEKLVLPRWTGLRPKSWSQRGDAVAAGIRTLKGILAHHGGKESAAAEWILGLHPWKHIREVVPGATAPEYTVPEWGERYPGAFAFGPKIGSFALNLHAADHPTLASYLTADLWFTRTWLRLVGGLADRGASGLLPKNAAERKQMYAAVREAAKSRGLTVADLQAILWYHEQRLYQLLGAKADSYSYRDGAEHMRALHARGEDY